MNFLYDAIDSLPQKSKETRSYINLDDGAELRLFVLTKHALHQLSVGLTQEPRGQGRVSRDEIAKLMTLM